MLYTKKKILALFMTAHWIVIVLVIVVRLHFDTFLWVCQLWHCQVESIQSIQHKPPREVNERTTHLYIVSWSSTSYPISANLNWQLYLLRRNTMAAAINWTLHERKDPPTPVQEWHSHSKHSERQNQLTTVPGVSLVVIICV